MESGWKCCLWEGQASFLLRASGAGSTAGDPFPCPVSFSDFLREPLLPQLLVSAATCWLTSFRAATKGERERPLASHRCRAIKSSTESLTGISLPRRCSHRDKTHVCCGLCGGERKRSSLNNCALRLVKRTVGQGANAPFTLGCVYSSSSPSRPHRAPPSIPWTQTPQGCRP